MLYKHYITVEDHVLKSTLLILETLGFCSIEEVAFSFNGGKDSTVSSNSSVWIFFYLPGFLSNDSESHIMIFRCYCTFLEPATFCIRKS